MLEAPDIFVSYASQDRERVRPLVETLRTLGWSVWWDRELKPGETWDEVIGKALASARCVVVLWSANSIASDWVRIEAEHARQRGTLVPAYLEVVALPAPLDRVHAADLSGWSGEAWHPAIQEVVKAIREKLADRPATLALTRPIANRATLQAIAALPDGMVIAPQELFASKPRVLDAAVASEVPVNRPADLIVMVRRKGSAGLQAILSVDDSYSAEPEDVRSSGIFNIEFPRDAAGRLGRAILDLKVHSPDFQVSPPEKRIAISPERDSTVYAFLVTPLRAGPLLLNLDLYQEDVCLASRVLRSKGMDTDREGAPSLRYVVSITLPVSGQADAPFWSGLDFGTSSSAHSIKFPDGKTGYDFTRGILEAIRKGELENLPSGEKLASNAGVTAPSSSPVTFRSEYRQPTYSSPVSVAGSPSPAAPVGGCLLLLGLAVVAVGTLLYFIFR
jgi:hypothetical protein